MSDNSRNVLERERCVTENSPKEESAIHTNSPDRLVPDRCTGRGNMIESVKIISPSLPVPRSSCQNSSHLLETVQRKAERSWQSSWATSSTGLTGSTSVLGSDVEGHQPQTSNRDEEAEAATQGCNPPPPNRAAYCALSLYPC